MSWPVREPRREPGKFFFAMLVPPGSDDERSKTEVTMTTFALIHGGGDADWYCT